MKISFKHPNGYTYTVDATSHGVDIFINGRYVMTFSKEDDTLNEEFWLSYGIQHIIDAIETNDPAYRV